MSNQPVSQWANEQPVNEFFMPDILPNKFIISACGPNFEIGYKGALPWKKFSHDMSDFSNLTKGRLLVMGRRTFQSLPASFMIYHRRILVVTSQDLGFPDFKTIPAIWDYTPGIAQTSDASLKSLKIDTPLVICGGAQLYKEHMGKMPLRLTKIRNQETVYQADTYFPSFKFEWRSCSKYGVDPNVGSYEVCWYYPRYY